MNGKRKLVEKKSFDRNGRNKGRKKPKEKKLIKKCEKKKKLKA